MPSRTLFVSILVCIAVLSTVGLMAGPAGSAGLPSPTGSTGPTPSPTGPAECSDDIDNDGDGWVDFDGGPTGESADLACISIDDDDEEPQDCPDRARPAPCASSRREGSRCGGSLMFGRRSDGFS